MESISQREIGADKICFRSKKLFAFTTLAVVASTFATPVKAQTFSEWFKQKSTQKKYLLQQIAALQVYAGYYKAANKIAHNGLSSITGSLIAENGLHTSYYDKLQIVNPVVKNNKQIHEILQWQKDILTRMGSIDKTASLSGDEKKYIMQVKAALFNDCNEQIAELQNVITDSKLKMSDEERLKHVGIIHTAMQSNYRFASAFSQQVKIYAVQRERENNNVITEKKVYRLQ
jgi:hypothetical protein